MESTDDRTLFVGNLSERVTEEIIYELFLQAGPLVSVKIPVHNGRRRPFGFVQYKHEVSVPYAARLFHHTSLYGRSLKLQVKRSDSYSFPEELQIIPLQNRLGPPPIEDYSSYMEMVRHNIQRQNDDNQVRNNIQRQNEDNQVRHNIHRPNDDDNHVRHNIQRRDDDDNHVRHNIQRRDDDDNHVRHSNQRRDDDYNHLRHNIQRHNNDDNHDLPRRRIPSHLVPKERKNKRDDDHDKSNIPDDLNYAGLLDRVNVERKKRPSDSNEEDLRSKIKKKKRKKKHSLTSNDEQSSTDKTKGIAAGEIEIDHKDRKRMPHSRFQNVVHSLKQFGRKCRGGRSLNSRKNSKHNRFDNNQNV